MPNGQSNGSLIVFLYYFFNTSSRIFFFIFDKMCKHFIINRVGNLNKL